MTSATGIAAPKQLGKYEVGAKIGGGGMASVYIGRADREDGTEQRVALKVIRDELANDVRFSRMFVDEAKILSRLAHPNVIRTLEYGVTGHHHFIAMELLSGRTYADVCEHLTRRGEKLSPALTAWICARVADGLHSAHELLDEQGQPLGVIHRDVNPGNIFLTHAGEAKLIDFGLVKARVRLSESVDGIVKGKIPYLAPEQAHGKAIDRRVDVYALGATLWESATMKRLFKRETDGDTLRAVLAAEVPDVRLLVEGFPDDLWAIIEKALRTDRDARYNTAEALRRELDAFVGPRRAEMQQELAATLARLFPGQEARQASWEHAASSVRLPVHTMPPPAPVPVVSTSMLVAEDEEDAEDSAEPATPAPPPTKTKTTTGASAGAKPRRTKKAKARARTSTPPPVPAPASRKARGKGKHKGKGNRPTRGERSAPPPPAPRERADKPTVRPATPPETTAAPRPAWVTFVVVAAVLLALALAVANR